MRLGEMPTVTQQEAAKPGSRQGAPVPRAPWLSFSTAPHPQPAMAVGSVLPSTRTWDLLIRLALKSMHQAQA